MKIYSWNVLYKNKRISEMVEFIRTLDADVICLQEVTPELLSEVKKSATEIAYSVDVLEQEGVTTYVVILSRHQIIKSLAYSVPIPPITLRAKITISLMELVQGWHPLKEKGAVYVDILYKGQRVRIYCLHLTIAGPGFRAKEFQTTLEKRDTGIPEIIAGDLNIVEHPFIKIYSWLLGSPLKEGMPWFPERTGFNKRLSEENLQNPLKGRITHPFSVSQLDHILLSPEFSVSKAWVEKDSHGSDHQPIGVECEIEKLLETNS